MSEKNYSPYTKLISDTYCPTRFEFGMVVQEKDKPDRMLKFGETDTAEEAIALIHAITKLTWGQVDFQAKTLILKFQ